MEAPKIPSMFKSRKPKQFNYSPRYWDPKEEARKARQEKYNIKPDADGKMDYASRIHQSFDQSRKRRSGGKSSGLYNSNIRVLIIIGLLLLIGYIIINANIKLF